MDRGSVVGLGAGAGPGVFLTNATSPCELRGKFDTTTLNIPLVLSTLSILWEFSGDTWLASASILFGPGVSGSTYTTDTTAAEIVLGGGP